MKDFDEHLDFLAVALGYAVLGMIGLFSILMIVALLVVVLG